ncbi:calcipressin-2-like [Glandiceps talaboti]
MTDSSEIERGLMDDVKQRGEDESNRDGANATSPDAQNIYESESFDHSDLPKALIATNVDLKVFDNPDEKVVFEDIFKPYNTEGDSITFAYLKNFRRVRIEFDTAMDAASARIALDKKEIHGTLMKLYFAQPPPTSDEIAKNPHLAPPPGFRQFLISPPSSPPVGWEPAREATPVINYDLLNALASLSPGDTHELHPADGDKPSIVVHVCENTGDEPSLRPKMIQTKCPDRR